MIIEKGIDMNKETNLEHYKKELKEIFVADCDVPVAMATQIMKRLDENIKFGAQTLASTCWISRNSHALPIAMACLSL